MEFIDTVQERKSIKAYLDKPVPKQMVTELLEIATRAPSASNMQCWEVYALTGDPKVRLAQTLSNKYERGEPDTTDPINVQDHDNTPEILRDRAAASRDRYHKFMAQYDFNYSDFVMPGSLCFFEAPVMFFFVIDKGLNSKYIWDIGAVATILQLAANGQGPGQRLHRHHPQVRGRGKGGPGPAR